jgi:hypothetical protein
MARRVLNYSIPVSARPAIINFYIEPVDPSELIEMLHEGGEFGLASLVILPIPSGCLGAWFARAVAVRSLQAATPPRRRVP